MLPASERKVILVTRRTRLEDLLARHQTREQARFYVEHLGVDFSDYQAEDARYKTAVREAQRRLYVDALAAALDKPRPKEVTKFLILQLQLVGDGKAAPAIGKFLLGEEELNEVAALAQAGLPFASATITWQPLSRRFWAWACPWLP